MYGPPRAGASEQFNVSHLVKYTFDETGESQITQQISLTNKLTGVYASQYTLHVKGENVKNITANDKNGLLEVSTASAQLNTTDITVKFPNPVVGKGNTLTFSVSYTGNPAIKSGQVWDVILGRLSDPNQADSYELRLEVPKTFGNPAYMSPPATSIINEESTHIYSFSKDQVVESGVVAGFGNFQTLNFSLSYHLENASKNTKHEQIALPPDTYVQRMFYESIEPRPDNVTVDEDGNWIASYVLNPGKSQLVTARGQVHLLGKPVSPSRFKYSPISLERYVSPTEYWPSTDPLITSLAKQYPTPRDIFSYVSSNLSYDYQRATTSPVRKGALNALASPRNSICTEYTDVFIALARANKIPSREIQGYALGNDPKLQPLGFVNDVLHAWPEYWDKTDEVWRQVDPTWSSTTGGANYFDSLDLSHFAFVIHGSDPRKPLPAGLYKSVSNSKDVTVQVGEYKDFVSGPPRTSWKYPLIFIPFINLPAKLEIKNTNHSAIYDVSVKLNQSDINTKLTTTVIRTIPPMGSVEIPFTVSSGIFPLVTDKKITVAVGGHLVTYNIPEYKFYAWYIFLLTVCVSGFIVLAGFTAKAWHLYLQKRNRSNHIRR